MRVIDCDCGTTLSAVNDEELFAQARRHIDDEHPDMDLDDDAVRSLVADQAYDATDS